MWNYLLDDFKTCMLYYKYTGRKGRKLNLASQDNEVVQDFCFKRIQSKTTPYDWMKAIDLNRIVSEMAQQWIYVSPFVSMYKLPKEVNYKGIVYRRDLDKDIVARYGAHISPKQAAAMELNEALLPTDLMMYLLITDKFHWFVQDNKDAIIEFLKQNNMINVSSRDPITQGQE